MVATIHTPTRLALVAGESVERAKLTDPASLSVVDWTAFGGTAPTLSPTPATVPPADVLLITWAADGGEYTALDHVFCTSDTPLPYGDGFKSGALPGWNTFNTSIDGHQPPSLHGNSAYWGFYRLVELSGKAVLLFKSNAHFSAPQGPTDLPLLLKYLLNTVKPSLVLSIGTAGGTSNTDRLGNVHVMRAASFRPNVGPVDGPITDTWSTTTGRVMLANAGFKAQLIAPSVTAEDLASTVDQVNRRGGAAKHRWGPFTLDQYDPDGLTQPTSPPTVFDQRANDTAVLTVQGFITGTIDNKLAVYGAVEMDDYIVAQACQAANIPAGFVRNISDPAQNPALTDDAGTTKPQGAWGGAIYGAYGLYTSCNGALVTYALLA